MNARPMPASVKVVLAIYALLCAMSAWQFFGSGQTQAAVSFTINAAILAGLAVRHVAAFQWARWTSALLAIYLLAVSSLAFGALLHSPAIAVWMAVSLAMCVTVFLLLGRRDAREYFSRPAGLPGAAGPPSMPPPSAWWICGLALAMVALVAIQFSGLAITAGFQGPTPRLIRAMAELPVALLLVFFYVFGGIVVYLLGFFTTSAAEPSPALFYGIAILFFAVFNGVLLLPLLLYAWTRSSVLLYLFAVLFGLYASFVMAVFLST